MHSSDGTSLIVIVPSRGRPDNIARLREAWADLTTLAARLLVAVDDDDPELPGYLEQGDGWTIVGPRLRLGPTLNSLAPTMTKRAPYIGFLGDDHLPRTTGWDLEVTAALATLGTGFVYGNDLVRGADLPTAFFMTSNIVDKLGYIFPPGLVHMYLDDAVRELGTAANCLTYLPDVIIEHLHPVAGTAPGTSDTQR